MAWSYPKNKLFFKTGWVLFLSGLFAIAIGVLFIYCFNNASNSIRIITALMSGLILLTGLLLMIAAITVWVVKLYKRLSH